MFSIYFSKRNYFIFVKLRHRQVKGVISLKVSTSISIKHNKQAQFFVPQHTSHYFLWTSKVNNCIFMHSIIGNGWLGGDMICIS